MQHGTTFYIPRWHGSTECHVHKISRVGVAALPTARSTLVFIVNARSISGTLTHGEVLTSIWSAWFNSILYPTLIARRLMMLAILKILALLAASRSVWNLFTAYLCALTLHNTSGLIDSAATSRRARGCDARQDRKSDLRMPLPQVLREGCPLTRTYRVTWVVLNQTIMAVCSG